MWQIVSEIIQIIQPSSSITKIKDLHKVWWFTDTPSQRMDYPEGHGVAETLCPLWSKVHKCLDRNPVMWSFVFFPIARGQITAAQQLHMNTWSLLKSQTACWRVTRATSLFSSLPIHDKAKGYQHSESLSEGYEMSPWFIIPFPLADNKFIPVYKVYSA